MTPMKRVAPALVAALLVLSACGDADVADSRSAEDPASTESSEGTDGGEGADALPQCADVWVEGQELPRDYAGCLSGETQMDSSFTECVDGRTKLVRHQSEAGEPTHFAITGKKIQAHSADGLDEAFLVCLPQDGV